MAKNESVLGVEVVQGEMKLVEMVNSAEGLEVTNFAIAELPPGSTRLLWPRLRNILKEGGFVAKTVNAVIPYPSIDYRQVTLPPMSRADMRIAAGREAGKDLKYPSDEMVFDYEVVGEPEEKGLPRTELFVARARQKDLEELSAAANEFGLKLSTLTVVPVVLLNLLRIRGGFKDEALAMVHIGIEKGTIIIVHNGNLRFTREFPVKHDTEAEELASRLAGEIKRSLLFIKQKARGLTVKKILLLGDTPRPDILADSIASAAKIDTEVYAPFGLDLSPLGDRVSEFRESLSKLLVPLGLAWTGPEHSRLNLLSLQQAAHKKLMLAKITVASVSILLAVLLLTYYIVIWQKGVAPRRDYERLSRELAALRLQTTDMREMQGERDLQGRRRAFINKMSGPRTAWREIFRTLSLSVPNELFLHSMTLKEADVGWILRMHGEVVGPDAALVQKKFSEFFSLLLTCPSLADGRVESQIIGPVTGARKVEASKLEFRVNVRVLCKEGTGGIAKG